MQISDIYQLLLINKISLENKKFNIFNLKIMKNFLSLNNYLLTTIPLPSFAPLVSKVWLRPCLELLDNF